MKPFIIIVAFIVWGAGAHAEGPDKWSHSFIGKLWGHQYRTRVTTDDLKQAATFDPETQHPPLGTHDAISKARAWLEDSFPVPPEWLESVQWHLNEVALRLVKEPNYWAYEITFKPSRVGDSSIWSEQFRVVVLMNGRVLEPESDKRTTDTAVHSALPPLKASVPGQMIQMNFRESPLDQVMDFYSNISGWKYTIASNTHVRVSIQPGRRCTPEESLDLIEKALSAEDIVFEKVSNDEIIVRRSRR